MKRLHLLLVLVCLAIGAWAQQITEHQAMDRALQFLSTNTAAKARGLDGKQLILKAAKVEAKTIYAFNLEGGGYVIASGDASSRRSTAPRIPVSGVLISCETSATKSRRNFSSLASSRILTRCRYRAKNTTAKASRPTSPASATTAR